ncbi:MAG TPA: 30S ribosome-binding factor RbfA [Propionibacteriaceae bacterium]|nr:30S ribosome-binding factor RbfA [Propionibacteriaceae bacterium]
MANPRVAKLADQIHVIVAEMLERRVKDPRLGFLTITDVRLTGDSRDATVFYTVLGGQTDLAATAAALESAKGLIRSTVGKRLGLRFAPTLTFVLDATEEQARTIEEALARAASSDQEVAARAAGAQYAGEPDPYRRPHEDDDDLDEDAEDAESADELGR